MSSSQPTIYSITSSDTITIDLSNLSLNSDDVNLYNNYTSGTVIGGSGSGVSTITLTGGGSSYTIGSGANGYSSTFSWNNEEFINCFPDWKRIEEMCKEYPGLQIAFEKFKTTYYLVKDDYDTPKDKKSKP